jgi:hypothetical protein
MMNNHSVTTAVEEDGWEQSCLLTIFTVMHLINKGHVTVIMKVILKVMKTFTVTATNRTANTVFFNNVK